MNMQSEKSQKGEIEFRKKLFQQQLGGEPIFDDEFDADGIKEILKERMQKTREQMTALKAKGVISPYIEIGAERCQRSMVMENDVGSCGAAVDISYQMLKSCEHYKEAFNKSKVPLRVCCDVYSLPFKKDSIPFVFCYQTLHHFPELTPVIKELHRVLAPGGRFFFDEEPYKKLLHLNLYKSKKTYSKEAIKRSNLKKAIDYFFSEPTNNETEYDIIENEDIMVDAWKKAVSLFEEKDIKLSFKGLVETELFNPSSYSKFLLATLLGGEISGVCTKAGDAINSNTPIKELLICPSCSANGRESKIVEDGELFVCNECAGKYPVVDNVLFLFHPDKLKTLYPDIAERLT